MSAAPVFALNHMCVPGSSIPEFFDLARELGAFGVEIRNDLDGNAIKDGTPPAAIREGAAERGLQIISINALQRFNEWNAEREEEARALVGYARECGAAGLVLVPTNDGSGRANGERQANLRIALKALQPLLEVAGVIGLVEPLGFETCSLRRKSEAVDAIEALGAGGTFRLVHDTFHHFLAGEQAFYPAHTGLAHISGVSDPAVGLSEMRDGHRVLVDERDRLDNLGQISALLAAGYSGPLSFEPFADTVHRDPDIRSSLARSMRHIAERARLAAA
jgi:2-keto-myo-inositol isomerase